MAVAAGTAATVPAAVAAAATAVKAVGTGLGAAATAPAAVAAAGAVGHQAGPLQRTRTRRPPLRLNRWKLEGMQHDAGKGTK